MFNILFGRSKPATGKDNVQMQDSQVQDPQDQGEPDHAEPPVDLDSVNGPFVVSPNTAKQIVFDLPDRSAEEATSIVNDLALSDPSRSSSKPPISGKRKRHETDAVDDSSKKRVVKESRATRSRDQPPTTSENTTIRQEGKSTRASSVTVNETPGKLRRPSRGQRRLPENQGSSAVQKKADEYDVGLFVGEQVENPAVSLTTSTRRAPSSEAVPRRRGRPRGNPSRATEKTSSNKGQRKATQNIRAESMVGERIEGPPSPEDEVREGRQFPSENSAPNTSPQASRAKNGADSTQGARKSKSKSPRTSTEEQGRTPQPDEEEEEEEEEEVEEEEEGGQESGNGGDVVHPSDKDRQTSTFEEEEAGDAQSDEQDSDSESEDSVNPLEQDEEGEKPELFGQDPAWETILEMTRSICGSKLPRNCMPELSTKTIEDLVRDVKEARDCYNELLPLSLRDPDVDSLDELNVRLRKSLDRIEIQIKGLSEETADTEGPEMIRDVHTRAIPAMVFLVQSALKSRVYHSEEHCNLETLNETVNKLNEIVDLQELAILLCDKAKSWKAKPTGLVRPTSSKIFRPLEAMHGAFSAILAEQKIKRKSKQNAVDYMKRERERELAQSSQQARQEAARKDFTKMIRESREREDNKLHSKERTYCQIIEDEARARMGSRHVNGHMESGATWTDEEDVELYYQLEKGYVGSLTCTFERIPIMSCSCSLTNHSFGTV